MNNGKLTFTVFDCFMRDTQKVRASRLCFRWTNQLQVKSFTTRAREPLRAVLHQDV